jgi:DNA-binding transcriptional ArsR family regulator
MTYGYAAVIVALADPTRRSIFERIRRRPHTVGELASAEGIRQPTASQHLQVLRHARLATGRRDGTRRFYSAHHAGLGELRSYVESLWDDVLAAYASADTPTDPPKRKTTRRKRS